MRLLSFLILCATVFHNLSVNGNTCLICKEHLDSDILETHSTCLVKLLRDIKHDADVTTVMRFMRSNINRNSLVTLRETFKYNFPGIVNDPETFDVSDLINLTTLRTEQNPSQISIL